MLSYGGWFFEILVNRKKNLLSLDLKSKECYILCKENDKLIGTANVHLTKERKATYSRHVSRHKFKVARISEGNTSAILIQSWYCTSPRGKKNP